VRVLEVMRAMARAGTRVCYMLGNHDPRFAELWGDAEALEVVAELEHTTADGRRILVVHGDAFDRVVGPRWVARIGDACARAVERAGTAVDGMLRRRRARLGLRAKQRFKGWLGYVARFERSALRAARSRRVDGIICGHVHVPASRTVDGLYYGNGGDWVGSATALIERSDGCIELLRWDHAA
jgi:UDP-2,3-diacylglucosamine pyrophosphatase LpxH